MGNIVLTPEHRYFLEGREYDSTTNIIQLEGGSPGLEFVDPWYLQRGEMIHIATALYDLSILDENSIDPRIRGYLTSWKRFRNVQKVEYSSEHIEVKMVDPLYRYAGTIDRLPLLDLKAGVYKKADLAQLGAYYGLCQANKIATDLYMGPEARKIVYLDERGSEPIVDSYTLREVQAARDSFLCCLNWNRFKNSK